MFFYLFVEVCCKNGFVESVYNTFLGFVLDGRFELERDGISVLEDIVFEEGVPFV